MLDVAELIYVKNAIIEVQQAFFADPISDSEKRIHRPHRATKNLEVATQSEPPVLWQFNYMWET